MSGGLLAALFPDRCVFCGEAVSRRAACCPACARRMPARDVFEVYPTHRDGVSGFAAPLEYAGYTREKILEMKSVGHKAYAAYFAARVEEAVRAAFADARFGGVTCVPNFEPEGKRVYNPARVMARALSRRMGLPLYADLLQQTREKRAQHTLPAAERARNVRDLYRAGAGSAGLTLLLIDDVVTTGATLCACALALLEARASAVYCAAPAATQRAGKKEDIRRFTSPPGTVIIDVDG